VMWVVGCVGGWWLAAAAPWRAPNEMKTGHKPIFTGAKLYLLGSCKYCWYSNASYRYSLKLYMFCKAPPNNIGCKTLTFKIVQKWYSHDVTQFLGNSWFNSQ
jgi:hypothetical protein